ncbi:hypothetical protein [Lacticaseibacillus jixiensis]|uniref:hypothetical protein n=1 Tax=Lacticaseibacillus jixiensis TaxID=3231926 RepID=UPI0036F3D69C
MQSSINFNQFMVTIITSAIGAIFSIVGSLIIMRVKENREQHLEVKQLEPCIVIGHSDVISISDDVTVAALIIEVPLFIAGKSSIFTIELEVGFSSRISDILDVSNPTDKLIKLKDLSGESWIRKSTLLEPISTLASGESTVMIIPTMFLRTIARRILRDTNVESLNNLIEQNRLILDVGISLRDSLMNQRR